MKSSTSSLHLCPTPTILSNSFLFFIFTFASLSSFAFDSEAWLGKREMLTREAERLRAAYSNCTARVDQSAEGMVVPIETYPNGAIKYSIAADRAQFFLKEGLIWADGVVITQLDLDGKELSRIEARSCVVDRDTKSGWVEGRARIVRDRTSFTGEGVYFSSPENYVISFDASRVESKDVKTGGLPL